MLITTRHYLLTTIFLACLVPTFILAPPAIRLWCLAGLVAIFASIATWFIPRQHHSLLTTRQVTKLCAILGLLYLALAYTSGLYTGFYRQTSILTPRQFFLTTIPTFLIIGCFELLRARLLSSRHTSFWTSLFCGVILDFFVLSPFYKVSSYDTLWHLIGYYLLPSVSINVLATYLTRRADPHPVTIYRWLTIFHLYFLPILPDAYPVIVSFYRLSFPLLTYLVINRYLTRPMIARPQPHARLIHSFEAITFSLAIIFIALVSCQFRYGALVVGSQSMTGTLEQGDLIIYDAKPKHLATGDIVVYRAEKLKIIHRLVGISLIEGQRRYTVQGDANQSPDSVLLTDSDIIGVVRTRLPAFGQPTLYLHEIIESTL